MAYEAKKYELPIPGLSDELMKNHFTLYEGYVKNTNKVAELLTKAEKGSPEYAELKRRFGWEFNGMRLHEYFFGAMTKDFKELDKASNLFKQIEKDFGSYEEWETDFKATAGLRGIGWAILYYDEEAQQLFNVWINEHDLGHLAGAKVILNIDVFEHAWMPDFGLKRAEYIEVFMKVIDWEETAKRI